MIITITGKPCSGKGTTSKLLCQKYNFEYIGTGNMFREEAKKHGYNDILAFQKSEDWKDVEKTIDGNIEKIGKTRLNDNIVFDSRLAWFFIPNSFKVFIDIDDDTAASRLLNANRDTESAQDINQAKKQLQDRWLTENLRYQRIYNTDNLNLKNYDYVISSKDLTPEEIVDKIYEKYLDFIKNK